MRRVNPWVLLFLVFLLSVSRLEAASCTINWVNNNDGDWETGSNWSGGQVPGNTDVVCIQLDAGYEVSLSSTVQVTEIKIGGDSNTDRQTLALNTATASILVGDELDILKSGGLVMAAGSSIQGASGTLMSNLGLMTITTASIDLDFSNYGQFSWVGQCDISQTFWNRAGASMYPADSSSEAGLTFQEDVSNDGTITFNGDSNQSITLVSGTLTNSSTGVILSEEPPKEDGRIGVAPPVIDGPIVNAGSIQVNHGLRLTADGAGYENSLTGTMVIEGDELQIDIAGSEEKAASSFTNLGTIDIGTGGRVTVSTAAGKGRAASSFTNLGTIDIGSGSYFSISETGKHSKAASSFTNLGTIDIGSGSSFLCEGAAFSNDRDGTKSEGMISGLGTLDISGAASIINNGSIKPGLASQPTSTGNLVISGDLPEGPTASLHFKIGGTAQGTQYDYLDIHGQLSRAGRIVLSLLGTFSPQEGQSFEIIKHQSVQGSFSNYDFPPLDHGLSWAVEESQTHLMLTVECTGGADLGIDETEIDKDPVSVNSILTFSIVVSNNSTSTATGVELQGDLGASLAFHDDDPAGICDPSGSTVVCNLADLAPGQQTTVMIPVEVILAGTISVPFTIAGSDCDPESANDTMNETVHATTAQPCDADADGNIGTNDVEPAVHHIFGSSAAGNPDCSDDGDIDAEDIAEIVSQTGG